MNKDLYEFVSVIENDLNVEDFNDVIRQEINKFEKRYKSKIVGVLIAGSLGLWSGRVFGGKYVNKDYVLSGLSQCDEIKLYVEKETKEMVLAGAHHDGVHYLKIYLVSESRADRLGIYPENVTPDNLERWVKVIKPLKLN